ncbi:hypothetical protein FRC00_007798 [Tulasnella sp. 408]|nr:hypothetical protein FRC00_007798 [Tulasnella sp. 408]
MAPVADEINADLDRRVNNGIVLTDVKVRHINRPTVIRFTVWLRNVGTQKYHKARVTAGKYRLVLTKQK